MLSKRHLNIVFQLFMISTYGLGFYYNDVFRVGSFFISDLFMGLILVMLLLNSLTLNKRRVQKSNIIIYFIALFMLMMGIFAGATLENVFRDFKIFLYFFVPYKYLKYIYNDYHLQKKNLNLFIILIFISLFLNWFNFLKYGDINLMDYGIIQRTFGIGLGFTSALILSLFAAVYKERFVNKYGTFIYFLVQIICFFSIVASFTRTVWIMYVTIHILRIILISLNLKRINKKFMKNILLFTIILFLLNIFVDHLESKNNLYYNAIVNRVESIELFKQDNKDTLSYRISDVSSAFYKFESPRILFGYGFGDLRKAYGYNSRFMSAEFNTENSFFYYSWKYGIFLALFLFTKVLYKLFMLLQNKSKAERAMFIFLGTYMLIGSMSGNLNNVYSIAIIAFYLGINLSLVFTMKKESTKNIKVKGKSI